MEQRFKKQAQLGVPHSRIQVELGFILQAGTCQILNFAQSPRQSQSVQGTELNWGWGGHCTEKVYTGRGTLRHCLALRHFLIQRHFQTLRFFLVLRYLLVLRHSQYCWVFQGESPRIIFPQQ